MSQLNFNSLINFIKKHKFILLILFLSTIFFIIQHVFVLSWDFIAYVLNAKHIFNSGLYFEIFRPPLTPVIIGLFAQITGYFAAEIIYIILVNILFCIATVYLSKVLNLNAEIFYLLMLTPFVLYFSLINGTELLSVTLLMFGIYFILKNNWISGLFIGLSALTRYTGIVFGAFLLFHKGIKNKIKAILLFCVTFVPWFIYNYLTFNNFFTSIADQYHQNIVSRMDIAQAPKLIHFISIQSILFIFTIIGLVFIIYKLINIIFRKEKILKTDKLLFSIIMLLITVYTCYSYFTTPFKDIRYLFALMLPIGYFTYVGINWGILQIKKFKKISAVQLQTIFYWVLVVFLIISSVIILYKTYLTDTQLKEIFNSGIDLIKENNLQDCVMYSETWIYYNYLDENIISLPIEIYDKDIPSYQNKVLLLYSDKHTKETKKKLLNTMPVVAKNDNYLILGDVKNCKSKSEYSQLMNIHNSLYTDPCNILFNKLKIAEKICNFVNYGTFTTYFK